MYRPRHFQPADEAAIWEAVEAFPLAALVSEGLHATHMPMLREGDTLIGHLARANPHWSAAPDGSAALAIFSGPSVYVSPGFYESKAQHGRVAPTWDYVAVHVRGRVSWLHEPREKEHIIRRLTDRHEASEKAPWSIDDAPRDYVEAAMKGFVGLRLTIESVEAQFKVSQNLTEEDRSGVELGLEARGDARSAEMAALVRRHAPREG